MCIGLIRRAVRGLARLLYLWSGGGIIGNQARHEYATTATGPSALTADGRSSEQVVLLIAMRNERFGKATRPVTC
jgi:hypothetical protein